MTPGGRSSMEPRVLAAAPWAMAFLVSPSLCVQSAAKLCVPVCPEGEYRLRVEDPHEARFEAAGEGAGDPNFPDRGRHDVVLRRYAPTAISLILQTETSGIVVPVEVEPAAAP